MTTNDLNSFHTGYKRHNMIWGYDMGVKLQLHNTL